MNSMGSLRCNPRVSLAFESAALAQLVEHHHGKVGVAGSSPAGGFLVKSQLFNKELGFFLFCLPLVFCQDEKITKAISSFHSLWYILIVK